MMWVVSHYWYFFMYFFQRKLSRIASEIATSKLGIVGSMHPQISRESEIRRIYCFLSYPCVSAVAFKKPTVSPDQLDPLDFACIGLFDSGANASEGTVFFLFFRPDWNTRTPAHNRLPTNPNFVFISSLPYFNSAFRVFLSIIWSYLIKAQKWNCEFPYLRTDSKQ